MQPQSDPRIDWLREIDPRTGEPRAARFGLQFTEGKERRPPASIRTNNPGAQWLGPVAQQYGATSGTPLPGGNNAAVFPTPEHGAAAHFALLDQKYSGMTLGSAIKKWGGTSDPRGYQDFVVRQTGIPRNKVLTRDMLSGPEGLALAKAQAEWEAGRPFPMSDDQWRNAQSVAFGGGALGNAAPAKPVIDPMAAIHSALGLRPDGMMGFAEDSVPSSASIQRPVRVTQATQAAPDMFEAAGFTTPKAAPSPAATAAPAVAPPAAGAAPDMFEAAGFTTNKPAPPAAEEPKPVPPAPTQELPKYQRVLNRLAEYPGAIVGGVANALRLPGDVYSGKEQVMNAPGRTDAEPGGLNPNAIRRAADLAGLVTLTPPGAATVAPGVVAKAASAVPKPEGQALDLLVKQIGAENVPNALQRLESNPALSVADVAPVVRNQVQGLIDPAQPKASRALTEAVSRRTEEAPGMVNSAYDTAMGPAPNIVDAVEKLKKSAQDVGRAKIEPAIGNAKPVDTSQVIAAIDAELKPDIQSVANPGAAVTPSPLQAELATLRRKLTDANGATVVDANRLHEIQSETGSRAYNLLQSASGADRNLGHDLRKVNEGLVDAIDAAAGGAYRPARAAYKDAKSIEEAFMDGFDVLKNRQGQAGFGDRPESLAARVKGMSPEQKEAMKLGVRADIDQKIRSAKNEARAGTDITRIEYNRDKLATLFGKQEADRLVRAMEDVSDMAATNAKLVAGSKTAETAAAQNALKVPSLGHQASEGLMQSGMAEIIGSSLGHPGIAGPAVGAYKLVRLGVNAVKQSNALERNAAYARNAVATGTERRRLMNALQSHPSVRKASQRNALQSVP